MLGNVQLMLLAAILRDGFMLSLKKKVKLTDALKQSNIYCCGNLVYKLIDISLVLSLM